MIATVLMSIPFALADSLCPGAYPGREARMHR
jgi:hypothetical protein